eukprot:scaffold3506_cov20-Tisochrysis_lutea.AAC.6
MKSCTHLCLLRRPHSIARLKALFADERTHAHTYTGSMPRSRIQQVRHTHTCTHTYSTTHLNLLVLVGLKRLRRQRAQVADPAGQVLRLAGERGTLQG